MRVFGSSSGPSLKRSQPSTRKFMQTVSPTGVERSFSEDQIIVSKTDLTGKITYANQLFCELAACTEEEAIGAPHSIVRHPDMPRTVFKLLWDTIQSGNEIFAYVVNMAKTGDHYWVVAHVTPSYDLNGNLVGYHSNRRVPDRSALEKIRPIYTKLLEIEKSSGDAKQGMEKGNAYLTDLLKQNNMDYDQFIFSLQSA